MSFLLSVTFACGLVIAVAHVLNQRFVAPRYDVAANLVAFGCATAASLLLGHWVPAALSTVAIGCWVWPARRTLLVRRAYRAAVSPPAHQDLINLAGGPTSEQPPRSEPQAGGSTLRR